MAKINGTTIGVYVGGTKVAASTNATIDLSVDEIEITSKDSLGNKEILPGKKSGTCSVDFLDDVNGSNYEFSDFYSLYQQRTKVSVRFSSNTSAAKYYIGEAYLMSVNRAAPMEDAVTGSASFTFTGKISEKTYT